MNNVRNYEVRSFSERLETLRTKANLSQGDLAQCLGISKDAVGYYENAARVPDINVAAAIAQYFGVSTDYLCGLTDVKDADPDLQAFAQKTGLSGYTLRILLSDDFFGPMFGNILFFISKVVNSHCGPSFLLALEDIHDAARLMENDGTEEKYADD